MARQYASTEVFKPNAYPELTYVDRSIDSQETYESRLRKALRTPGLMTLISGTSKSGKTVLYHSVVPSDQLVEISGAHIRTSDDFWNQIAEKIEVPSETEVTTTTGREVGGSGEISGNIPLIASGKGTIQAKQMDNESLKEKRHRSSNVIVDTLIQHNKVVVVDDFHYIPADTQLYIARILKSELFYGLKAILVTLPHRADDAIRMNPDLSGRVRFIDIEPWKESELKKIPEKGFELLGIDVPSNYINLLVQESITSPQLMQQNCLNLAFVLDVDTDSLVNCVGSEELVKKAFVETTRDLNNYEKILEKWSEGPSKGRTKRALFTVEEEQMDIYKLILLALAKDPPLVALKVQDIQRRVTDLLKLHEKVPNTLTIGNTISNIQKVLGAAGNMYQILDWRDQELHILDPFFLFYIRWHSYKTKC